MGGEGKDSGNGTPQPAAHLPFFSPLVAHHSAKRGSVERNLPIYDLRFTRYDLRGTVYDRGAFTASERRHARSAINTIRSVVIGNACPPPASRRDATDCIPSHPCPVKDNIKCVVPAGRFDAWCAASFYRASVPGGTWGICKVRGAICDVRFTICETGDYRTFGLKAGL